MKTFGPIYQKTKKTSKLLLDSKLVATLTNIVFTVHAIKFEMF